MAQCYRNDLRSHRRAIVHTSVTSRSTRKKKQHFHRRSYIVWKVEHENLCVCRFFFFLKENFSNDIKFLNINSMICLSWRNNVYKIQLSVSRYVCVCVVGFSFECWGKWSGVATNSSGSRRICYTFLALCFSSCFCFCGGFVISIAIKLHSYHRKKSVAQQNGESIKRNQKKMIYAFGIAGTRHVEHAHLPTTFSSKRRANECFIQMEMA